MQKTALHTILREEILRAIVFGGTFFVIVLATLTGVANAANGGFFGDILNKILASGDFTNAGDGTVKNAEKLGGYDVTKFQKIATPNQSCSAGQCIYGFDTSGNILCR